MAPAAEPASMGIFPAQQGQQWDMIAWHWHGMVRMEVDLMGGPSVGFLTDKAGLGSASSSHFSIL